MTRSRLLSLAAILAGGLAGCAHCDTCDDFPVPCTGPGCNTSMRTMGPGPIMGGPIMTGSMDDQSTTPTQTITPPPLPEVPAEGVAPAPAPEGPAEGQPAPPAATLPPVPPSPSNP